MVDKVPVACPNCRVRVRMPLGLRPGKKPRCPKCKTIIRPEDVLPPSLLGVAAPSATPPVPTSPPIDRFAETKSLFPEESNKTDLFAETKTLPPDGIRPREVDPYAETVVPVQQPKPRTTKPGKPGGSSSRSKALGAAEPRRRKRPPLVPRPLSETSMAIPVNLPPPPLEDTSLPFPVVVPTDPPSSGVPVTKPEPPPLEETRIHLPVDWLLPPPPK